MQSADCRLQISTINICRIGQHECFLKNPLISKSVQLAKNANRFKINGGEK